MGRQVVVYDHVVASVAATRSGFIIGVSNPNLVVAFSTLTCRDAKVADAICPAGLTVIGMYNDEVPKEGFCCWFQDDGLLWTLEGIAADPVFKTGDPFADFVVLFTSFNRRVAPALRSSITCRVLDDVVDIHDRSPCQRRLPKKRIAAESFAHPFAFTSLHRVLPVDILVSNSNSTGAAPRVIFSKNLSADVIDVIVVVQPNLEFADAFQLLLLEAERILEIWKISSHHYYGVPKVHFPVATSGMSQSESISAALNGLESWNALRFVCSLAKGERLYNVHRCVRPSDLVDNKQYLVSGAYGYFHYLQGGFNDDGWGCAYRSLQTLWSWSLYQRLTTEPVPDFRRMQEIICECDDKPKSFIGSRQWIGAIELSSALSSIGILCKILPLGSGAEFATKGRELSQHFKLQGSPVMIGGGVLAYTLLGVDINEFTGDIRFLILDPHYKGEEDIDVIIKNGWCAWRSSDLFDQTAFYNLCMPQKPAFRK